MPVYMPVFVCIFVRCYVCVTLDVMFLFGFVWQIRLTFNENVQYTKIGNRRFVLTTPNSQVKFEIPIADPTMSTSGDPYRVDIEGRDLIVKPDIRMSSLPEGTYLLAFEGGIVEDLQGNGNLGATNFTFDVSANAGCAFLGVTGFTVDNVNLNGIYRASSPLNNKPKWTALGTGQHITTTATHPNTKTSLKHTHNLRLPVLQMDLTDSQIAIVTIVKLRVGIASLCVFVSDTPILVRVSLYV